MNLETFQKAVVEASKNEWGIVAENQSEFQAAVHQFTKGFGAHSSIEVEGIKYAISKIDSQYRVKVRTAAKVNQKEKQIARAFDKFSFAEYDL